MRGCSTVALVAAVVWFAACDQPGAAPPSSAASAAPSSSSSALGSAAPSGSTPTPPAVGDRAAFARAFVSDMGAGKWDEAARRIPPKGDKALDGAAVKAIWESSAGSRGSFVEILSSGVEPRGARTVVRVRVKLTAGTMHLLMQFDEAGTIRHFRLVPAKAPYEAPKYVDAATFESRDLMLGEGNHALPGTLTVPRTAGNHPTVILVHGSGGGDRDESNDAGSRPFRDLAEGLASRGIAALRWDKRTGDQYGLSAIDVAVADLTIEHEYLNDVAAAIALARKTPGLDASRVFLAGHSMGGWLIPWFLKLHPEVAGGILLAGPSRHFTLGVIPQYEHIARLDDGRIGFLEQSAIDDEKKKWALAADPKLPLDTPASHLPFNGSPKYWLSIVSYDAVKTAKEVAAPLLIMQGGRDYQVTEKEDFAGWKRGLAGRKETDFALYANLNHAFVPGEGMATPDEYGTMNGHVDEKVIDDIVQWLPKGK